jgi:nucleoside diphosphate kinase
MKPLSYTLAQLFNRAWIFVVIKPGFLNRAQDIVNIFNEHGWKLSRTRTKQLTLREAKTLYLIHKDEDFYDDLCNYMSSDISTGMIFEKSGQINKEMFEETNKIKDQIREAWGESDMRNVLHSSDSLSAMESESQIYF